jgi:hypothetical protein|tara:strand:- start:622 stop:1215 length:594 start_codon:yes stop_codon:yes gene_type:complete
MTVMLSLSLSVVVSEHAYAQRKGDIVFKEAEDEKAAYEAMILKNYRYNNLDFKIMNDFYQRCMRDGSSAFFKCECLANKYINKKVVYADTITDYEIHQETAKDCVDITAVAGMTYTECSKLGSVDARWSEEYCECYANKYAKEFAASNGYMTNGQQKNSRSDAMKECNFAKLDLLEAQERRRKLQAQLEQQARDRMR